jgi:hypothetical protein
MLAMVVCFAVGAQTVNVIALDQADAQTVPQAAKESAPHGMRPPQSRWLIRRDLIFQARCSIEQAANYLD